MELAQAVEQVKEVVANATKQSRERWIRLGIEISKIQGSYFYKDLLEYIKTSSGEGYLYFYRLKPLYDEFGYNEVNQALIEFIKEEKPNE